MQHFPFYQSLGTLGQCDGGLKEQWAKGTVDQRDSGPKERWAKGTVGPKDNNLDILRLFFKI